MHEDHEMIARALDAERASELRDRYVRGDNIGDGHIKMELTDAINVLLEPMRQRRAKLETAEGEAMLVDLLKVHTRRANAVAEETLAMAKKAMKLDYFPRSLGFTSHFDSPTEATTGFMVLVSRPMIQYLTTNWL
jgi:hypothetical protein